MLKTKKKLSPLKQVKIFVKSQNILVENLSLLPARVGYLLFTLKYTLAFSIKLLARPKLLFRFIKSTHRKLQKLVTKPIWIGVAISIGSIIFFGYSLFLVKLVLELPSPNYLSMSRKPLTTEIYDRHGRLLYQIYEGQNRKLVKLHQIPQDLINATIAIEDKYFYSHPGIDISGTARAIYNNFNQESIQGGSTITQQLIKNTLLTSDRTFTRKVKEAALSFWAERIYNKDEILQMYFNEAPYGGIAWGIESAAEIYFGKPISKLNLAEMSYLAGLPASPTQYSPYGIYPEKGLERQKEVLRRMAEDGYITNQQAQEAISYPLSFRPPNQDIKAPHFVMYVRQLLAQKYGERTVSQGGLKVVTSLDWDIQELTQEAVSKEIDKLRPLNVGNGAAMVTDAKSGQILAMVGSKDYFDPKGGNFNATLALRQPGSSIKPVTYATAFKQGYSPGSLILDTPTSFPNPWGQRYSPVNYDGKFHGPVTIRTAFGSSYNIPAVKLLAMVGIPAMAETARDMGITTLNHPESYGLSLTLGGGAVKMIDMMSVYTTLASGGVRYQPLAILTVKDSQGNILEDNTSSAGKRVLTPQVAYLITNILSDNQARTPAFGPHSLLHIPKYTVAVKTGTSDEKRDNLTFGYNPEYVVGVWVGNFDNSPMNPQLTSGVTGAAPIWNKVMIALISSRPNIAFERPSGILDVLVGGKKDIAISGQSTKTAATFQKTTKKDQKSGEEKEVITYTDPFSTFIPNSQL